MCYCVGVGRVCVCVLCVTVCVVCGVLECVGVACCGCCVLCVLCGVLECVGVVCWCWCWCCVLLVLCVVCCSILPTGLPLLPDTHPALSSGLQRQDVHFSLCNYCYVWQASRCPLAIHTIRPYMWHFVSNSEPHQASHSFCIVHRLSRCWHSMWPSCRSGRRRTWESGSATRSRIKASATAAGNGSTVAIGFARNGQIRTDSKLIQGLGAGVEVQRGCRGGDGRLAWGYLFIPQDPASAVGHGEDGTHKQTQKVVMGQASQSISIIDYRTNHALIHSTLDSNELLLSYPPPFQIPATHSFPPHS